jgi:hypothetical protein
VKLINLDVFGPDGTGSWSDLITAINWAVSNRGTYNITSINMSLGGGESTGVWWRTGRGSAQQAGLAASGGVGSFLCLLARSCTPG